MSRRCEKKLLRMKLLLGVAGVAFLIAMVLAKFDIEELESANQQLGINATKQGDELTRTKTRLEKLESEVAEFVSGRIPYLHRIEFDKTIPVDQNYVRNVIFTLTGVGDDKKYEYRIVMHNDSMNIVHPFINVFLFDELGIQVGATKITKADATTKTEYTDLKQGETRSYSAMVPLERNETPYYFLLTYE